MNEESVSRGLLEKEKRGPAQVLDITGLSQLEKELADTASPILIDFWAPWCSPCQRMLPIFEAAADRYQGKVRFARVNVQASPQIAREFNIRLIPTLAVFYQGEVFDVRTGLTSEGRLRAMVRRVIRKQGGTTLLDRIKGLWRTR